jgi:hypothetical protein
MTEQNPEDESFEETLRSMAEELGRHLESSIDSFDSDRLAESFGVDPTAARQWVENTSSWLRARAESLGAEVARRVAEGGQPASQRRPAPERRPASERPSGSDTDLFGGAAAHPLDVPTEEQGLALAALDSGRWTVEPGSDTLTAKGDGPGPSDTLGIVRELRVRDWIAADGELTLVGRHALSRWLHAADRH